MPPGMGATAGTGIGATGRGIRHGSVWANGSGAGSGSCVWVADQHLAGADKSWTRRSGRECTQGSPDLGGADEARACATGVGAELQWSGGAGAAVFGVVELPT